MIGRFVLFSSVSVEAIFPTVHHFVVGARARFEARNSKRYLFLFDPLDSNFRFPRKTICFCFLEKQKANSFDGIVLIWKEFLSSPRCFSSSAGIHHRSLSFTCFHPWGIVMGCIGGTKFLCSAINIHNLLLRLVTVYQRCFSTHEMSRKNTYY